MTTGTRLNADLGLTPEAAAGVTSLIGHLLADAHVLYIKSRKYHWNVVGPHFQQLHKLFEDQYTQLEAEIDLLAERIRSLGGEAPGTMAEFLEAASLREEKGRNPGADGMLHQLLADHEAVTRNLREAVARCEDSGDAGTADMLTGLMEDHEKTAWMLRAHLE
jgi:starvation-inducible DNA-binding protein